MSDRWYEITNVDQLMTPALAVYPSRVDENIRRMIVRAGGVERLRPHVKTHKMAHVCMRQLNAGITKFKCATIAEAEMLGQCGAPDVMLAYQLVGPNVSRFVQLAQTFPATTFSCAVDDEGAIRQLAAACAADAQRVRVWLDLDVGMHRTGIAPGDRAAELYRQIAASEWLEPAGLHVYDGHIRNPDFDARVEETAAAFAPVRALRDRLLAEGLPVPTIVAGGTPTFPVHARTPDIECSPGTCVFWDHSYGTKFVDMDFLPAALVLTRVVSKPAENRLCLDLGYKAISADNPDPRVLLLDLPEAKMVVHSEEHLAVEAPEASRYSVGDVLYGVPFHICPTVALHREAIVVEHATAAKTWPVAARDRMLTI